MAFWLGIACQLVGFALSDSTLVPCRALILAAASDDRLTSLIATLISSRPWPQSVIHCDSYILTHVFHLLSPALCLPVGLISCAASSFHLSFPIKLRTNKIVPATSLAVLPYSATKFRKIWFCIRWRLSFIVDLLHVSITIPKIWNSTSQIQRMACSYLTHYSF